MARLTFVCSRTLGVRSGVPRTRVDDTLLDPARLYRCEDAFLVPGTLGRAGEASRSTLRHDANHTRCHPSHLHATFPPAGDVCKMRTWGVLSATADDARVVARFRGMLTEHLDGVVEVPSRPKQTSLIGSTILRQLVAGMSSVPQDVERIAYVDADVLDTLGIGPVLQMISWLDDDHAAVVRAVPVTDALKTVDGTRLVGSVDRRGLYAPQPPHIVRRDALDAALLADVPVGGRPDDLAGLLVGAGHAVRVVWDGLPPVTLSPRS